VSSPAPAPIRDLFAAGQSIWLDFIRRGLLDSGELAGLVESGRISGLTSNPTIFEKAIGGSSDYDGAFEALALTAPDAFAIFDALAIEDIRRACDVLRPVWERTQGVDGYASIEVEPWLAHDTAKTLAEARRLRAAVDRPNVLVKIPATAEGLPAIRAAIGEGISINITLIFAVERYEQVVEAYLAGLEDLLARGGDPRPVASVASFFVSRVDTLVDPMLAAIAGDRGVPSGAAQVASELEGRIAVANARVAYGRFKALFSGPRWEALAARGARVQRPLWASTGTKNKAYPDTKYVAELIGPDTVNTMPPDTLAAFADHGVVTSGLDDAHVTEARAVLARLAGVGIDLAAACARLERDGVRSFADSFEQLLAGIEARRQAVRTQAAPRFGARLGALEEPVRARLLAFEHDRFAARLAAREPSLWSDDPDVQAKVRDRLGWLDAPAAITARAAELEAFAVEVAGEGFTDAVVLGMGGSSLCPDLLARTFPPARGRLRLHVLDSTDPTGVLRLRRAIDPAKTLFVVSTKSGTTIETLAFADFFAAETVAVVGETRWARHFVAVTDPGSPLETRAIREHWRRTFLAPADVGGRYSALTVFGLLPAALLGIDLMRLASAATAMAHACGPRARTHENPGLVLGAFLGEAARARRDKLTFVIDPPLAALGGWLEQLIAESTGKNGTGIVPVVGEPPGPPAVYAADRAFVSIALAGEGAGAHDAALDALAVAGHPVVRLVLDDLHDVAGEFVRFEVATVVAGAILGVDPFDEPNVSESKANTARALARIEAGQPLSDEPALVRAGPLAGFAPGPQANALRGVLADESGHALEGGEALVRLLEADLGALTSGDAWTLLAYADPGPAEREQLEGLRRIVRDHARVATALGLGPRYLHSTGQLHKGGPPRQAFLVLTFETREDCAVPGTPWSFGVLCDAQAAGDVEALAAHRRRVVRIHLEGPRGPALTALATALERAATARTTA
jgi:transaldolase/glucose-6-phosphate isomerase